MSINFQWPTGLGLYKIILLEKGIKSKLVLPFIEDDGFLVSLKRGYLRKDVVLLEIQIIANIALWVEIAVAKKSKFLHMLVKMSSFVST